MILYDITCKDTKFSSVTIAGKVITFDSDGVARGVSEKIALAVMDSEMFDAIPQKEEASDKE